MSNSIDLIRVKHRERCFAMDQRKRLDLALGAFLRLMMGWRKDLPDAERKAIAAEAARMIDEGDGPWSSVIAASHIGSKPFEDIEGDAKKEMVRLAKQLPVWDSFGADVRGFGEVSLAVIVGEAGDLSNYATHSKLWRRMGMAPLTKNGITRSGCQWKIKGGLNADDWSAFGYSPRRRSAIFVIEEALYKTQGPYRDVYLARKEYLRNRAEGRGLTVAPAGKIPANRRDEFVSLGHVDQDAKHYMGKRLLRDLWRAWRRAKQVVSETTVELLPAAEISNGEANADAPTKAIAGLPPQVAAMPPVPKGHDADAATTNSLAGRPLPKGQSMNASEAPATHLLPKGRMSRAGAKNSLAKKLEPKGLPTAASEVSAVRAVPKGHSPLADTKNMNAPKGAGEAITSVPSKATPKLPLHQSRRPSP